MRAAAALLSWAGWCVAASGCAATQSESPTPQQGVEPAVGLMADTIAEIAALRHDLSSMKICVHRIEGRESKKLYGAHAVEARAELESIAIALEHEFVAALSGHMYVIDTELAGETRAKPTGSNLQATLEETGATDALVGHFVRTNDNLLVSVRLVEAKDFLILAAASGTVSFDALVERGALAWVEEVSMSTARPASSYLRPKTTRPEPAWKGYSSSAQPTPTRAGPSTQRRNAALLAGGTWSGARTAGSLDLPEAPPATVTVITGDPTGASSPDASQPASSSAEGDPLAQATGEDAASQRAPGGSVDPSKKDPTAASELASGEVDTGEPKPRVEGPASIRLRRLRGADADKTKAAPNKPKKDS